jgi:putative SOS response-associated peptidase YedK
VLASEFVTFEPAFSASIWFGEEPADAPQLKALLVPYPSEEMVAWRVSPRAGNVKNNDPSLIEPIAGTG